MWNGNYFGFILINLFIHEFSVHLVLFKMFTSVFNEFTIKMPYLNAERLKDTHFPLSLN